jgi:ATPase subunit of ABC transporter with duplicated ATPase domains
LASRRVALCRLLLEQPDLLLLDEPINHLDAESVSWLEGHLRNYPGAILIVTHDRYFLDSQLWRGQRGREEEEIDMKNYTACVVDFDADRLDDSAAFGDLRF